MKIQALVGAAALSALLMAGAAYAQDAGTMAPIPNPPEAPKASHHGGKHHHSAKHHSHKASKSKADAPAK